MQVHIPYFNSARTAGTALLLVRYIPVHCIVYHGIIVHNTPKCNTQSTTAYCTSHGTDSEKYYKNTNTIYLYGISQEGSYLACLPCLPSCSFLNLFEFLNSFDKKIKS